MLRSQPALRLRMCGTTIPACLNGVMSSSFMSHKPLELQTLPESRNFSLTQFLKKYKEIEIITFLHRMPNFSLWERRRNVIKVAEECCWVISQAVGQSCHGRSGSCVFGFGFQLDYLIYTQTADNTYTQS